VAAPNTAAAALRGGAWQSYPAVINRWCGRMARQSVGNNLSYLTLWRARGMGAGEGCSAKPSKARSAHSDDNYVASNTLHEGPRQPNIAASGLRVLPRPGRALQGRAALLRYGGLSRVAHKNR